MKKKINMILCVFLLLLFTGCGTPQSHNALFYQYFDTVIEITASDMTPEDFQNFKAAAEESISYYHRLFDKYHDYEGISNLKTINDSAFSSPVSVDAPLYELISRCIAYCDQTDGALDISKGAVLSLWSEAREQGKLPDGDALQSAQEKTGISAISLNEKNRTVSLLKEGISLDLGAVAKGYAVEETAKKLEALGYTSFLINGGGNVKAVGKSIKPDGQWTLGLQSPHPDTADLLLTVKTSETSMVTSGSYQRYFTVDGKTYGHIIDPETLYPAANYLSVTAICPDSGIADMLSTSLFILDKPRGDALLKQYHAQAIWVYSDGKIAFSDGLKNKITILN